MHRRANYDKIPMMKKIQNTFTKVLQGLLVVATLITMIALGIFLWNIISNNPNEEKPPIVDPSVKQTFAFEVKDFTLFEIEEFGFDFILANIHVESNKPINLSLSHFVTSEGVQLNSVDNYLSTIESLGYNFGDYKPVFSLSSTDNTLDAMLFIPIKDKDLTSIDLNINIYPNHVLNFDLENPTKIGTVLDLELDKSGLNPSEDLTFTFSYADYFEPSNFYTIGSNGENVTVDLGTNIQILGIKFKVENSGTFKYRVANAEFKIDGVTSYPLLNPEYLLVNSVNLASISLTENSEGLLFFTVPSVNFSISSYGKDKFSINIVFTNNQELIINNALGN